MTHHLSPEYILFLAIIGWFIGAIPPYVVGTRIRVKSPGVAFVPGFGPYIVILRSIKRSGWLCLLILVPIVSLIFVIWLAFTVPAEHHRTGMWGLAFLIPLVNLFAFYAYAFTFDPDASSRAAGALGSTYHVPPGGDWRL